MLRPGTRVKVADDCQLNGPLGAIRGVQGTITGAEDAGAYPVALDSPHAFTLRLDARAFEVTQEPPPEKPEPEPAPAPEPAPPPEPGEPAEHEEPQEQAAAAGKTRKKLRWRAKAPQKRARMPQERRTAGGSSRSTPLFLRQLRA